MNDGRAGGAGVLSELVNMIGRQALRADPQTVEKLRQIEGGVIEIRCTRPPVVWHLTVAGGGLLLNAANHAAPHAIVHGPAPSLLHWLFDGSPRDVEITGDTGLVVVFADILRSYSPDLAEPLAGVLGPDAAQSLLGNAELGLRGIASLIEGLLQGATASLQRRAAESYVDQTSFDRFSSTIDQLRVRIDHVAGRIAARDAASTSRGET